MPRLSETARNDIANKIGNLDEDSFLVLSPLQAINLWRDYEEFRARVQDVERGVAKRLLHAKVYGAEICLDGITQLRRSSSNDPAKVAILNDIAVRVSRLIEDLERGNDSLPFSRPLSREGDRLPQDATTTYPTTEWCPATYGTVEDVASWFDVGRESQPNVANNTETPF